MPSLDMGSVSLSDRVLVIFAKAVENDDILAAVKRSSALLDKHHASAPSISTTPATPPHKLPIAAPASGISGMTES